MFFATSNPVNPSFLPNKFNYTNNKVLIYLFEQRSSKLPAIFLEEAKVIKLSLFGVATATVKL